MKYVIHYNLDGCLSAARVDASTEADAISQFKLNHLPGATIIKVNKLEVKHNAVPRRVEYKLRESPNIKQRRH